MKNLAIWFVVAAAVLTACGSDPGRTPRGDGSVVEPQEPVTMTPEPGSDVHDVDGRTQRVRPRRGMADLRQVAWEDARQSRGGRSLRIVYWSGVEPCHVLDHVDVDYSGSEIVVTLFEGHHPDAGDVACIEVAVRKVVLVPLEEPVGGRRIVDGAER